MCLCVHNSEAHYSITNFSLKYAHDFQWIESSVHFIQSNLSGVSEVERSKMKECRVKGERGESEREQEHPYSLNTKLSHFASLTAF